MLRRRIGFGLLSGRRSSLEQRIQKCWHSGVKLRIQQKTKLKKVRYFTRIKRRVNKENSHFIQTSDIDFALRTVSLHATLLVTFAHIVIISDATHFRETSSNIKNQVYFVDYTERTPDEVWPTKRARTCESPDCIRSPPPPTPPQPNQRHERGLLVETRSYSHTRTERKCFCRSNTELKTSDDDRTILWRLLPAV